MAGKLRERVTIQHESTTGTPEWGPSLAWVDVATVWASVEPTKADETFTQKGTGTATGYTVRMRYRPGLLAANRLVLRDGRVLDIVGVVDVDGRRRELEIRAVAHG